LMVQRGACEQYRLPEPRQGVDGPESACVSPGALPPLRRPMLPLGVAGAKPGEEQPRRTNQATHRAVEFLPVRERSVLGHSADRYRLAWRIATLENARLGIGSVRQCGLGLVRGGHVLPLWVGGWLTIS